MLFPYVYLYYAEDSSDQHWVFPRFPSFVYDGTVYSHVVYRVMYPETLTKVEDILNWGWRYDKDNPTENLILEKVEVKAPRRAMRLGKEGRWV